MIPGPGLLSPLVLLRHGGPANAVRVLRALYDSYGERVRLRLGLRTEAVVLYNPDDYLAVHRAAGACPYGATDALWMLHEVLDRRGAAGSMQYGRGESWMRVRRSMQPPLLPPGCAAYYAESVNRAARHHVERLGGAADLQRYLECASLDMVSSALLGGQSVGDEDLMRAVVRGMTCASRMLMGPLQRLHLRLNTPTWREWERAVHLMLDRTEASVAASVARGDSESYVGRLLERGQLTPAEIACHVPGLLFAGFETVASTLHWTLIHLARHPTLQEELRQEVAAALPVGEPYRTELALPLLRCFHREVHRVTPTAFAFVRKLPGRLELPDGVHLPADSWICFSPLGLANHVPEPERFDPHRYLRRVKDRAADWDALADHPLMRDGFGFGPRRCLGATLAKLELNAFSVAVLQRWRVGIDPSSSRDYAIGNHAATFPAPGPRLSFSPL